MRLSRAVVTLVALSAIACGGSSSTNITGNNNNNSSAPMSATIDGAQWSAPLPQATYRNNILSVAGIDLGLTASVSFGITVNRTGTYSLDFGHSGIAANAVVTKGGQGWTTGVPGGTGSLTITALTANHAAGTFVFDAAGASGGATGTVHVTNGKFDITF